MNSKQKFKKGDKVRIIKYGAKMWHSKKGYPQQQASAVALGRYIDAKLFFNMDLNPKDYPLDIDENAKPDNILSENDDIYICDWQPQLVGLEGIIEGSYADLSELNHWGSARDEKNQKEYSLSGINGKICT